MRFIKQSSIFLFLLILFLTSCSTRSAPVTREDQHMAMLIQKKEQKEKKRVLQKPVVVIDAGHGGEDYGTHSVNPVKYHEKYLALTTAMMLNNMLQKMGYKTFMTRTTDTFIPLKERARLANEVGPKLFVSVHYNSAPSRKAHGVEVFFYESESNPSRMKESKKLAKEVLDGIIGITNAKSRGVKHGNFLVIRETKMPAILVEGGFLTNEAEMELIKDSSYQRKVAWGIADGIKHYLTSIQ